MSLFEYNLGYFDIKLSNLIQKYLFRQEIKCFKSQNIFLFKLKHSWSKIKSFFIKNSVVLSKRFWVKRIAYSDSTASGRNRESRIITIALTNNTKQAKSSMRMHKFHILEGLIIVLR